MKDNNYVPFVSEVEEFNALMNKPNNYEPTIPDRKEWEFVYNFVLEELEEYKQACEKGDIVEILDALSISLDISRSHLERLRNQYRQQIKLSQSLLRIKDRTTQSR